MAERSHADHRKRMRDKFEAMGEVAFNDYEIMEMLLFNVIPRCDVSPIAHALIDGFGSMEKVLEAPKEVLMTVRGMGEKSASYIKLLSALYNRAYRSANSNIYVNDGGAAAEYVLDKQFFAEDTEESLYIMVLDDQNRLLSFTPVAEGWQDSVEGYTRSIAKTCFQMGGNRYILIHNHPSGVALPSSTDMRSSLVTENSLTAMGLTMLDCIIIADGDYVSLAQSNLLLRMMTKEQIAEALGGASKKIPTKQGE